MNHADPGVPMFEYRTRVERLEFPVLGDPSPLCLNIETLLDLDQTIDELFAAIDRGADSRLLEDLCPYFGVLWAAGLGLAQYLAGELGHRLEGKRVLEVGCGLGVPSLVAAKLGAQVTATDFHPDVPWFLKRNQEKNQVRNLEYRRVDWRSATDLTGYDWIIGSDILYEKQHPAQIVEQLDRLASVRSKIVVADPGRSYWGAFLDSARRIGRKPEIRQIEVVEPGKLLAGVNTESRPPPTRKVVFLALM